MGSSPPATQCSAPRSALCQQGKLPPAHAKTRPALPAPSPRKVSRIRIPARTPLLDAPAAGGGFLAREESAPFPSGGSAAASMEVERSSLALEEELRCLSSSLPLRAPTARLRASRGTSRGGNVVGRPAVGRLMVSAPSTNVLLTKAGALTATSPDRTSQSWLESPRIVPTYCPLGLTPQIPACESEASCLPSVGTSAAPAADAVPSIRPRLDRWIGNCLQGSSKGSMSGGSFAFGGEEAVIVDVLDDGDATGNQS